MEFRDGLQLLCALALGRHAKNFNFVSKVFCWPLLSDGKYLVSGMVIKIIKTSTSYLVPGTALFAHVGTVWVPILAEYQTGRYILEAGTRLCY